MNVIENKSFNHKTLAVDDCLFVGCNLSECELVYGGGEFSSRQTTFNKCRFTFTASAQRTVNLLISTGLLKPSGGNDDGNPGSNPNSNQVVH